MQEKSFKDIKKRDIYVPDDLEKINLIMDGVGGELSHQVEEYNPMDDALIKIINRAIYNQDEKKSSANYKVMADYLSILKLMPKRTADGKKMDGIMRLEMVNTQLRKGKHFENLTDHFGYLTELLFKCSKQDKWRLLEKLVEFPLECIASYIQCTTNSDAYLRRKYFDGQIRKRKDGTTYKRKYNISTEADLIYVDEEGKEWSPIDNAETTDLYFDNADDLLSTFKEEEKEIARLLLYLSSGKKPATLKELEKYSNYTKRQLETIKKKLQYKALLWLDEAETADKYIHYYEMCKKYKGFEENYKKFLKSVKK